MIINDILPLNIVESEGFSVLMSRLIKKLKFKKGKFFTEKLDAGYSNTKTSLMLALKKSSFVSTTADIYVDS